jgi:hypothetical protein
MKSNLTAPRRRPPHGRARPPRDGRADGTGAPATVTRPTMGLERGLQVVTAIIAPTTLLTALLFYFGWIRTNALFQYFGVDATVLGFTTQDYLLRSSEALYVPLGTLLVVGLAALWLHSVAATWLAAGRRLELLRRMAVALALVGLALFARGVAGVALPRLSRADFLVTPVCLGLGAALGAYGRWLWLRRREVLGDRDPTQPGWAGTVSLVLVVLLVVVSLFWATTNYAREYGRGRADQYARLLAVRPGVIVYSADRLFLNGPDVVETTLPAEQHTSFRYRYSGLRLLTESRGHLFLLPAGWTRSNGSAIVLADNDKIRVEFLRGLGA